MSLPTPGRWLTLRNALRIGAALLGLVVVALMLLPGSTTVRATTTHDAPAASSRQAAGDWTARAALLTLIERLTVADDLMHQLRVTTSPTEAHQLARGILDQVTGPNGRHAGPDALVPGVFPSDLAESVTDPGLALTVFDGTTDERVQREFAETIVGDVERWRRPSDRWNEIDAVLAAWKPDDNTMPRLDGHLMRVVGWSVLTLQSDSAKEARGYASHGRLHTGLSLEAARRALIVMDDGSPKVAP